MLHEQADFNTGVSNWNCSKGQMRTYSKGRIMARARPMYRYTDIYRPIWRCCRCIVSEKFHRYISAIFAHESVALLLCMERSETQVATSYVTLIG